MVNIIGLLLTKHGTHLRPETGEHTFWQTRGAEYARKLFSGVDRHTQQAHHNFLITDAPELAPPGVTAIVTQLSRREGPGWWGKMAMFAPGMLPPDEKALYLDLDNVVCGPLDPILDLFPATTMLDDVFVPRLPNASALLFRPRHLYWLWEEYSRRSEAIQEEFSTWPRAADQAFIADRFVREYGALPGFMQDVLPKGTILNSRVDIEAGADYSKASLVFGGWHPKPHESSQRFYAEHWA